LNSGDSFFDANATLIINSKLAMAEFDVLFFSCQIYSGKFNHVRYARDISAAKYTVPAVQQATVYKKSQLILIEWPTSYRICGDYFLAAQFYKNNASSKSFDEVISRFEIGGVSTVRFIQLAQEAARIQREYLGLNYFLVAMNACRRILSGVVVWGIRKIFEYIFPICFVWIVAMAGINAALDSKPF